MDIFVKRLNSLIKETGVTKYRLAKEINVSIPTLTYWTKGINEPKISHLKAIADYFGVCADYLIGRQEYY